jgi:hypothetical protein
MKNLGLGEAISQAYILCSAIPKMSKEDAQKAIDRYMDSTRELFYEMYGPSNDNRI